MTELDAIQNQQAALSAMRGAKQRKARTRERGKARPKLAPILPFVDSLARLEIRIAALPKDEQAAIARAIEGRDIRSVEAKFRTLKDALMLLRSALTCQEKCCRGISREKRLEGIL